ncbi:imidazolonepropionase [Zeaxanthinibacter sp. PT1]|uniref:imidazolonepropionase n=1 Tax=Zeaxanthinibacter TaxID=561554 RepID=UPI002348FDBF|nr:imidazolonepropionase [Zeaxanthinibacter sp. PT1]MDC6350258.1 imidazolonepropionase [Zeaxanthinibacter sp. PT1]
MANLPLKGALQDEQLNIIENGGIIVDEGIIQRIGSYQSLQQEAEEEGFQIQALTGDHVCIPGLIDSHTHICFGGSRARDYAYRNAGKTYLEIAKAGGGIWDTVMQTRASSEDSLVSLIKERAEILLSNGVTTIEVKSGYGLTANEELKMLRAIKRASADLHPDLIPTCLAAHMLPRDYDKGAESYLDEMSEHLFPVIKEEGLASRVDAFVEESAFSPEQIKPYFEKARNLGFAITVHADQFSVGGSQVAIDCGAVSADHLEASTEDEIRKLAASDVIATALPGATIGLGCGFTPARKLLDSGAALAIASDWNPGSAPMGDLLTQAAILGTFEKLTNAEVLAGITFRAAAALQLNDRGIIGTGKKADFVAYPTANYQEILYRQGSLTPSMVWTDGELSFDSKDK